MKYLKNLGWWFWTPFVIVAVVLALSIASAHRLHNVSSNYKPQEPKYVVVDGLMISQTRTELWTINNLLLTATSPRLIERLWWHKVILQKRLEYMTS